MVAVACAVVGAVSGPTGFGPSGLTLLHLLRWLAAFGLLILGHQLVDSVGHLDFSSGAQIALASALVVGLGPSLGGPGAIAAALAVAVTLGCSLAWVVQSLRAPCELASLALAALVVAGLPEHAARLAPEAASVLANGTAGAWVPWLFVLYLAVLGGAATLRAAARGMAVEPEAGEVLAHGAAAALWAVVGVWLAGWQGPAVQGPLWPAVLGTGAALWLRGGGVDLTGGLLTAAGLAAAVTVAELRSPVVAFDAERRLLPVISGLVLLVALAVSRSAHADQLDLDAVGGAAAGIDDDDGHGPDLAGREVADRDGPRGG